MAARNFDNVMEHVYTYEGGYVDHPKDPGGATNMGITIGTLRAYRGRPVSKTDVKRLTKGEASLIYKRNYWDAVKGDHLPYGFDLVAMDGAVNSGVSRGAKWLQRGVGAVVDGKVGGKTIELARASDQRGIVRACDARMSFLQGLTNWKTFGRGWGRRVAQVEALGVRMWLQSNEKTVMRHKKMNDIIAAAPKKAANERRSGKAQAGTTGAAGAGGAANAVNAGIPWEIITVAALSIVVIAALLAFRAYRKARYHEEREVAYLTERDKMS